MGDDFRIIRIELVRGDVVLLWQIDFQNENTKEQWRTFCSMEDFDMMQRDAIVRFFDDIERSERSDYTEGMRKALQDAKDVVKGLQELEDAWKLL